MRTITLFVFSIAVNAAPLVPLFAQRIIQNYAPARTDSLRIGVGEKDFLPYIAKGYTLMLPAKPEVKGVLIFLEDSGYDGKNGLAQLMYKQASKNGFAVLSVSTELPFDFYFSPSSAGDAHRTISAAFREHQLPNENIFFIGIALSGHRAMKYIATMKEEGFDPLLNITGIVLCNTKLDWAMEWYKYDREKRNNRNDLREPTFANYMLETNLNGTPKTNPEAYYDFSAYSYFDETKRNVKHYTGYPIRAYIEPAITYWLKRHLKTMYDNNSPDAVGLLAELELAGNTATDLVVFGCEKGGSEVKNAHSLWKKVDKRELMRWIKAVAE